MNRDDEAAAAREALDLATPAERAALAARAAADPELARELDRWRRAARALRDLGEAPALAPPPGFAARLEARARAEAGRRTLGLPGRPPLAAAAATLLLAAGAGLGAGLAALAPGEAPSIDPELGVASLESSASLADLYLEASAAPPTLPVETAP